MKESEIPKMPIGFQMALAHNISSLNAFLKLNDSERDKVIEKARGAKTKRELQLLVNSISLK